MNKNALIGMVGLVGLLAGCGERTVIDDVKDAHIAQCPAATVGDMLVGYFSTTNWTAYSGDTETTKVIYGEGELLYVGVTRTARLEFILDQVTGQVTLGGLSFNGQEQPFAMAEGVISAMCEEATG